MLSENLKACRMKIGLTQAEVAEKLMVSRKTISGWENSRSTPDINSLVILSELYKTSVDGLLCEGAYLKTNKNQPDELGHTAKVLRYSYYLNFFLCILGYVNAFQIGHFHTPFITLGLLINIFYFLMHFDDWNRFASHTKLWVVISSYIIYFVINVILNAFCVNFFQIVSQSDPNFAVGFIMGRTVSLIILSFSLLITVFFRVSQIKNDKVYGF